MPPTKDLYTILGVPRDTSQEDIRKAYLKLAHKYHPDKTGGDKAAEQKLKAVNAAYDVLKNPEKRSNYDQFGSTDGQAGFGGGFGGQGFGGGFEAPFEDFFDVLFGQGSRRRPGASRGRPGNDLELRLKVTLAQAAMGAKRDVHFARLENCGECKGSGAAAGSSPEPCPQCGGTGQIRAAQGFFSVTRSCGRCQGSGQVTAKPCRKCSGQGRVKLNRELSVDVPAGVDTGSRLRVTGEGEAGLHGGPRGDLYIAIEVEPHDVFEREGPHLICEVPITFVQAAVGATIRVPTLKGEADLKVPSGTQSGAQLRLRGLGLPDLRGYRQGDQVVILRVETPAKLSRAQKKLLNEFDEAIEARNYPLGQKFKDRVKRMSK